MNASKSKVKNNKQSSSHELSPREVALDGLVQIIHKGRSLADLQIHFNKHQHSALIREMVFGVCRWFYYFEHQAKQHLKKPIRKKDHDVLLIIFLGMYQLQFMNTSDHAAVHETVNLVFKIRKKWAKGLVNALLRKYSQIDFENIKSIDHALTYPSWMQQKINHDWPKEASDVFQYGNNKAALSLRLNSNKISSAGFLEQLDKQEIEYQLEETLPAYVRLLQAHNVVELPGFEQGAFYVQDGSAQMASQLLDVKKGMRVLDACAAPGGKSTHLVELSEDATVIAVEKDAKRIQRLKDNVQRLGHDMTILCGDASKPADWFDGELFDRILIDAPCSASGIIRRHPDIKLLRRAEDIDQLAQLQADILKALWPLLKQGGELLYCTCSIFKQENEQQLASFLEQHNDASEMKIEPFTWSKERPVGLQILPLEHGFDGFYYAKLIKSES